MTRSWTAVPVVATALLLAAVAPAAADSVLVASTFDTGAEGWTSNTPAEVAWSATAGNPGGALFFTDRSGAGTYIIAPASFRSPKINYKALNNKAYFSWQQKIGYEKDEEKVANYQISLSGPDGAATFSGGQPPNGSVPYKTIVAPLVEGDWTISSGTWLGLLKSVTRIQIAIELVSNDGLLNDKESIDNIELVYHPSGFNP